MKNASKNKITAKEAIQKNPDLLLPLLIEIFRFINNLLEFFSAGGVGQ